MHKKDEMIYILVYLCRIEKILNFDQKIIENKIYY
jgi:hypothetical protein